MWAFVFSIFCTIFGTCGEANGCRDVRFADVDHVVCSYDVAKIDIRLFLYDEDGEAFGRVSSLQSRLDENVRPLMLMNGGMYHDDLSPVGLYVQAGKKSQQISLKDGWGNFHLLPNGVFWGKDGRVGVTESKSFDKRIANVDFATQSGPMLVIDGRLHPRFLKDSDSLKVRNGVGISKDGTRLHFAISRQAINFWNFGKLFQEELDAHNALFLDGTVSAIEAGSYRQSSWKNIGPIIGVFAKN